MSGNNLGCLAAGIIAIATVGILATREQKYEQNQRITIRVIEPASDLDQNGIPDRIAIFENGYRQPLFCIDLDSKAYSAAEMKTRNPLVDYAGIEQRLNTAKE